MIWSSFKTVVYPVGFRRSSSSCTCRTVLGPRRQSTRRIPSSASVGRGVVAMPGRLYEAFRNVNERLRSRLGELLGGGSESGFQLLAHDLADVVVEVQGFPGLRGYLALRRQGS